MIGAIESNLFADQISWKSDQPVWLNQWPLKQEKLQALQQLVTEQLQLGHLEESNSPWNTPVFVIKKKSRKWRLLQDLRAVNATMHDMGALQPGLPSPVAVPKGWEIIIIDLQDCFFNIKLHPEDCKRFAFSVPSPNFKRPYQRFQWKVLPQGMKNSPTLCQKFVDKAILTVRDTYQDSYIVHYMDDILLAHPSRAIVDEILTSMIQALNEHGLVVSEEKIQKYDNLKYLGTHIQGDVVSYQKLQIRTDKLRTLNDFQKLLGNINWIRPFLKLTTGELKPLFEILNGDSNPISIRKLTPEACKALQLVNERLSTARVKRLDLSQPWSLCILKTEYTPTACLWQNGVIEWIHLPHISPKVITPYDIFCTQLIIKGRHRSKELFSKDPDYIVVPYTKVQFDLLLQEKEDWPISLLGFLREVQFHLPKDPLLTFTLQTAIIFPHMTSTTPLEKEIVIFTDGSANGRSVTYIQGREPIIKENTQNTAQQAEIVAVITAFEEVSQPFNLYTDSKYVTGLFPEIETATLSPRTKIYTELRHLQRLIHKRQEKFYIGHIRGHTGLPGPLAQGNAYADSLTRILTALESAQESHALHHQNAAALRFQFHITREQAREIVKLCPNCPDWGHAPQLGVNPRGLKPRVLWQMDVTHVSEFGKLKYVHVTVDTYSHFTFATARTGEATKDVLQHLAQSFAYMGIPQKIKTDNAPAYVSRSVQEFLARWKISHVTGIPYNPQGQAIVERTHQNIKAQINKLQKAGKYYTPHHLLAHALFVLNHVNMDNQGHTAAERHWGPISADPKPMVMWKDLLTGSWKGPDVLITAGRGYACVFPQDAESPIWVPDRFIRPFTERKGSTPTPSTAEKTPPRDEKDHQEGPEADPRPHQREDDLATTAGVDLRSGGGS